MARRHTVHLIDACPYVFRAYYSLPPSLVAPDGTPIHAVRGFAGFLLRYLNEEAPSHVALTFDESLTTSFRNEIYPAYKSGREVAPPDLEEQLALCQEIGRGLGMAVYADDRYEADDLIATLAHGLGRGGHRAVVVSNDKDLAQLVDGRVTLYDFARGERYGPAEAEQRFGVLPEQMTDFLGLAGDAVDDIPGVRGIGAKGAGALLAVYQDLEAIYENLEEVATLPIRGARSLAARLVAGREDAFLSRELATVARDAPVRARLTELAWRGARRGLLEPLLARLGMEGLAGRVTRWRRER